MDFDSLRDLGVMGVLFDVGGVLVEEKKDFAPEVELLGLIRADAEDALAAAYWAHRDDYDLGLPDEEYWQRITRDIGVVQPSPELLDALINVDVRRWTDVNTLSLALVEILSRAGIKLGILSNAPTSLAKVLRGSEWVGLFDYVLFSSDIGVAKPDKRAFDVATNGLDLNPGEILFFDDRESNIAGAKGAGLRAHLWIDAAEARSFLL